MRLLRTIGWGTLLIIAGVCSFVRNGFCQSIELTTEQLADRADVVVIGRVTSLRSEWNADRTSIVTRVNIAVDQTLKGEQPPSTLTLTVPGGEVGGVGELYSHVARFRSNEDVLVFAERDARGTLRIVGGDQGKLPINVDERSGKRIVFGQKTLDEVKTLVKLSAQRQSQNRE